MPEIDAQGVHLEWYREAELTLSAKVEKAGSFL